MNGTSTCACGQPVTQEGEFRCYDCWSVATDDAFPANGGRGTEPLWIWLVAGGTLLWFVISAVADVIS